jgi:hypothetical protein
MRRLAVIPVAIGLIAAISVSTWANPNIGGDSIHEDEVYFSAGEWGMTAYSYVFDDTSNSVPDLFEGFSGLDEGEMLFVYVLEPDPMTVSSISYFSINNEALVDIYSVGWSIRVVPSGYNVNNHQDPFVFTYSGPAEATVYNYTANPYDPTCELDPGEYSLVYYFALADSYGDVHATADSQGQGSTQFVPGPLCVVDFHHFARFADHWLQADCNELNNWCGGADLNYNSDVNSLDLRLFADEWLDYCPVNWPLK